MRGNRGVASAGPPQAIDAQAGHFEKGDFPHLAGAGNIVNAQARSEFLAVGDAVGQRILEIAADVVVRLHGHDIGAVGEQKQVAGNLQVMGPGEVSAGEEADGLQFARIRGIQNRDAVAEHVADVKMPAVEHDLNAVRPSANDRCRTDDGSVVRCLAAELQFPARVRCARRQAPTPQAQQTFPAIAPSDRRHVCSVS